MLKLTFLGMFSSKSRQRLYSKNNNGWWDFENARYCYVMCVLSITMHTQIFLCLLYCVISLHTRQLTQSHTWQYVTILNVNISLLSYPCLQWKHDNIWKTCCWILIGLSSTFVEYKYLSVHLYIFKTSQLTQLHVYMDNGNLMYH